MAEVNEPTAPANDLDEEGHFFDFVTFYKKPEFCDRTFRLEIVKESTNGWFDDTDPFLPVSWGRKRARPSASSSHTDKKSEKIPVCSTLVAAKSAVLRAMLSNGMKESDKSATVTIKVTEEESAAFKEMLGFLYSGELQSRFQDPEAEVRELIDLLILGDRFQVPSFTGAVLKCITGRERTLTDSAEIMDLLPDALEQRPQIKAVADEARAHILDTFKDVSGTWQTPMFSKLGVGSLEFLLQSEDLEAESEEKIARGVLQWAKEDHKRRVSRLVPHIRFPCVRGETLAYWFRSEEFGPLGTC